MKSISDILSETIASNIKKEARHNSSQSTEPFLRYIGAKFQIAPHIVPHFKEHKVYIEPFLGSGSVFFYKPKAQSNLLNDVNSYLINLFTQVKDNLDKITEWIWLTPFSIEYHNKILRTFNSPRSWAVIPKWKQAAGYFYLLQLAYNESVGNLAFPSYKISKGKQKWCQEICNLIYNCSKKLNNVILDYRDYRELIQNTNINQPYAFWYIDPPYTMADDKKYYQNNFRPDSHIELVSAIKRITGSFMISYDDSPLIREIYSSFHITKLKDFDNEIIITNYELENKQQSLFEDKRNLL